MQNSGLLSKIVIDYIDYIDYLYRVLLPWILGFPYDIRDCG